LIWALRSCADHIVAAGIQGPDLSRA
jgi:hypothetical protein